MKLPVTHSIKFRAAFYLTIMLVMAIVGCASNDDATPTDTPATSTESSSTPVPAITEVSNADPTATTVASSEATATVADTPIPPTNTALPPTETVIPEAVVELEGVVLPAGFSLKVYSTLFHPTSLSMDSQGRLFATSQDGTVHVFTDSDQDGHADSDIILSSGFNVPLGIAIDEANHQYYVSHMGKISIIRDANDDLIPDEVVNFVDDLPFGRHQNNTLKFGPDGWLYLGVGSTCDVCYEEDPRSATIMRFDPATGLGEVVARGLRNAFDLAFHPISGDLFATENGRDDLGLDGPLEELNLIRDGGHYGFPDCWDFLDQPNCSNTERALAFFESHSSANSLDFYRGELFPAGYQDALYVAVFGSWLKPNVQTGIQRIRLESHDDGSFTVVRQDWFAQWPEAMPLGLISGTDGALYVGDYINNRILRISYGN